MAEPSPAWKISVDYEKEPAAVDTNEAAIALRLPRRKKKEARTQGCEWRD